MKLSLRLDEILDLVLKRIESYLSFSALSTIRLVNQNTGELELEASHDLFGEDHGPFVGGKKASFAQSVVDGKQAVLITDAANDPAVPFLNTTAATICHGTSVCRCQTEIR